MKMRTFAVAAALMILCLTPQAFAIEFDEMGGVEIHGFLSQGFIQSTDNNFFCDSADDGSFQFNEFALTFSKELTEKLRMGIQLIAYDLGDLGNDEVQIDWAFADYRWRDWLGIRLGKTKLAFGLYNEIKNVDLLTPNVFMPLSIYNETWREAMTSVKGLGVYGSLPLGVMGSLSYNTSYGQNDFRPGGGESRLMADSMPNALDLHFTAIDIDSLWSAQILWDTFLSGLRVGASYRRSVFDADTTTALDGLTQAQIDALGLPFTAGDHVFEADADSYTLSAEFIYGDLTVAAEFSEIEYDLNLTGIAHIDPFKSQGYYGSASYRFADWFQLAMYYSEYYRNKDDKDGDAIMLTGEQPDHRAWSKDFCLTTRFDISDNWIIKLEGHAINGTGILLGADAELDDDGNPIFEEDWVAGIAKITYTF